MLWSSGICVPICLVALLDVWKQRQSSISVALWPITTARTLIAHSHPSSIPWMSRCPYEFRPILDVKKSSHGLPLNDGHKPSSTYVPWLSVFGLFGRPFSTWSRTSIDCTVDGGGQRGLRKKFSFYFFVIYFQFIIARMPSTHKLSKVNEDINIIALLNYQNSIIIFNS